MATLPDPHDDHPSGLPRLVRLYITQVLIGFALSAVFVGLLIGFNVANLRSLMMNTQGGWIAALMLFFFNGLVFAGVQFAITIMRMGRDDDQGPKGGRRAPVATRAPARVAVAAGGRP